MKISRVPGRTLACLAFLVIFGGGAFADEDAAPPPAAPPPVPPPSAAPPSAPTGADRQALRGAVPIVDLEPVVVTATRVLAPEAHVARSLNIVPAQRVFERSLPSVADALDDQIGVWVEKRTAHTSDLVIRGLSGGNLLALVDGNTLSTFWGEGGFAGDDMYGKIDPDMIERVEVVRGPSSVLYGSNALGGVVNFITKSSPFDFTPCGIRQGAKSRFVLSSSPDYWRVHQEVYGASPRVRWIAGFTHWHGGDTRDGGGQIQSPTGGHGYFANTQVNVKLSDSNTLNFTTQYTNNGQVFRYYRPTQSNSNERLALAAWLDLKDLCRRTSLADEGKVSLYFQRKEDERRWYDAATSLLTQRGVALWETARAGAQFTKRVGRHELTYGADVETTWGESPDDEQFTITAVGGTPMKASPDSVWSSFGGYVQDVWKASSRLTLTGSVRYDLLRFATDVDAQYVPAGGLPASADEFTDTQSAIVGGLQASYQLTKPVSVYGGWNRGFRQFAPHFGVTQHAWGVVVPSQLLDPVTADQFELGFKYRSECLTADVAAYYTRFQNFQNVIRSTFQGQDWYDFDGNAVRDAGEDVYVTTGNGKAYVVGVELAAEASLAWLTRGFFGRGWTLGGGFMWNRGQDETNDIPLRHTHPARAMAKLRYEQPDSRHEPWVEIVADFVRRYDRIPPDRLANDVGYLVDPQDGASGMLRPWGLPGYTVIDIRGGVKVSRRVSVVVGVDNVFDKLYRPAHARWDAPGRSLHATLDIDL